MKSIEDIRKVIALCRERREAYDNSWHDENAYTKSEILEEQLGALCPGCCNECNTLVVLNWIYPELEDEA